MADEIEADWLDLTTVGSAYEEQLDVRAPPSASPTVRYRHRVRRYTGQPEALWKPGPAPPTTGEKP